MFWKVMTFNLSHILYVTTQKELQGSVRSVLSLDQCGVT